MPEDKTPTSIPPNRLLLTKKEAAQLLGGICVKSLERLIAEKKLRSVKIGRRVLVPLSACVKFAEGRLVRGGKKDVEG